MSKRPSSTIRRFRLPERLNVVQYSLASASRHSNPAFPMSARLRPSLILALALLLACAAPAGAQTDRSGESRLGRAGRGAQTGRRRKKAPGSPARTRQRNRATREEEPDRRDSRGPAHRVLSREGRAACVRARVQRMDRGRGRDRPRRRAAAARAARSPGLAQAADLFPLAGRLGRRFIRDRQALAHAQHEGGRRQDHPARLRRERVGARRATP